MSPPSPSIPPADVPLLCHRCGATLTPGREGPGAFYVVRIEAFADPTPPMLTAADLAADTTAAFRDLLEQMKGFSEQELMDSVYRRLTLHLCVSCYRRWIEHPAG